jgi:hypothetical protein
VGVLVSDTMMFQRGEPHPSDKHLSSFYGLALPLLERAIPVEPVQIESATKAGFLDAYRLLFLTYEGQKPPDPAFHDALAAWVRRGGALVFVDDDSDPYNSVREWWNTGANDFHSPREHLFHLLDLDPGAQGLQRVGNGVVLREPVSPASLAYRTDGGDRVQAPALAAAAGVKLNWSESNALVLRRGPYVVAAGLEEAAAVVPMVVNGKFIDLFDARLPVVTDVSIGPGRRALLLDIDAAKKIAPAPRVIAAACRIRDETTDQGHLRFRAEGIAETNGVAVVLSPSAPREVRINDQPAPPAAYDFADGVLRVRFTNSPEGVSVGLGF